jgi:hypothetical protein
LHSRPHKLKREFGLKILPKMGGRRKIGHGDIDSPKLKPTSRKDNLEKKLILS